jgi:hypothetical protein
MRQNECEGGEPYMNSDVAPTSVGDLTEAEVEGIGKITDPLVSQVVALAAAFGVPPHISWIGKGSHLSSMRRRWGLWLTRPQARY